MVEFVDVEPVDTEIWQYNVIQTMNAYLGSHQSCEPWERNSHSQK